MFAKRAFILTDCIKANHISNILSLYWLWTCGALMAEWKSTNKSFTPSPVAYYFVLFLCLCCEPVGKRQSPIQSSTGTWKL